MDYLIKRSNGLELQIEHRSEYERYIYRENIKEFNQIWEMLSPVRNIFNFITHALSGFFINVYLQKIQRRHLMKLDHSYFKKTPPTPPYRKDCCGTVFALRQSFCNHKRRFHRGNGSHCGKLFIS